MAYGRRGRRFVKSRRSRRFVRRRRLGRGRSWLSTGMSLARQVWKLKGLVNSEMFKFDSTFVTQPITLATPMVQPLHGIAQGDGDNSRTGNSIFARAWNLKGLLYRTAGGDAVQMVRLSVVMDTQQGSDAVPAYTDIYEQALPYAHLNSNSVGRFKVLYSQVFTLDVVKGLSQQVNINIPMRHHIRYNGVNGTDIQRGGLYFCAVSTQGSSDYPLIDAEYRLSYHDN